MTKNTDSRSVTQVQLPESSYQAMVLIEFWPAPFEMVRPEVWF
jgi:hypothetical protein